MEQLSPKQKGELTELKVLAKLAEYGVDTYIPFGENSRADIVVDNNGLKKIQIKTVRRRTNTSVQFNCTSTRSNFSETTEEDYKGDVDAFIVWWPDDNSFYWIPIDDAPKSKMTLRTEPTKNGQTKGINFTVDYELEKHVY
jgi:hypothetical protein